jgi:hypothetical protein
MSIVERLPRIRTVRVPAVDGLVPWLLPITIIAI